MSRAWLLALALCWLVAVAGCTDGGVQAIDSGRPRVNRDAGLSGDATMGADAARAGDGGPAPDSGTGDACTVAGPIEPFGVSCATSTFECLGGCTDGACQRACLDADPMPDACFNCVLGNLTSCAQDLGCQGSWDTYYCCVEAAGCFELDPEAGQMCAMGCDAEFSEFQACANPLQPDCFPVQRMCFPP